jgi:hypothetical protein
MEREKRNRLCVLCSLVLLAGLAAMAVVDQKIRNRRYAALCYEIAARAGVARADSILRLGDNYATHAIDPQRVPSNLVFPTEHVEVEHKKCGRSMQFAYSLPRIGGMP